MITLTSQMILGETRVDPALSQVYRFIIGGWPKVVDPAFAPIKSKREGIDHPTRLHIMGHSSCCSYFTSREGFTGIT